jgi:hypothetical protein
LTKQLHERSRLSLELVEALERRPRLALEGGEDLEGLSERFLLAGERLEGVTRAGDHLRELLVPRVQRLEGHAGVADEALQRHLLPLEDVDHVGGVSEERAEVAERVVEVEAAVADRNRRARLPALERRARFLVQRVEDLVDLRRLARLAHAERAALGNCFDGRGVDAGGLGGLTERHECHVARGSLRGLGSRRELDVGLAQQRLLTEHCPGVG